MMLPTRILSLLLLLILIAQILPNTTSYQCGKIATKRCNSAPKRESLANTGEEHEAVVIRGNKRKGEQILSRRPLSQSGGKGSAEFVAFTADYKSPRHHPPRHN
ncbi:uncharacterized protein LOC129871480 [Solanum dulcamara]|uniref:uncharacterized protein LOC129871480 n=1 Tax=Solanum dulcamara TaxID=45834 RepID=UPI002486B321|nr:uncharacterized protein LOC129871480 [Solanum dulcamara]